MAPTQKDGGYGQGYEYFGMALTFVVAILVFGAAGWYLDGKVHTQPLLAIVGAFVGGFLGFLRIYYRVRQDTDKGGNGR
ncbi:MAG TPA: AtpZ/AtpI family protein [Gemmatimonadales bacterium]|nr:AtpZ/AtpI family protein [Gemmatimonadales bacterium]